MNNGGCSYRGFGKAYSEEENKWLTENIDNYTYPEMTRIFNEMFNRDLRNVSDHCIKYIHLKKKHKETFSVGRKDFISRCEIGYEKDAGRDVFVKVSDEYIEGVQPTRGTVKNINWKRKQDIVWEEHHGNKPENGIIVFLDKNNRNYEIGNLYCTNRKVNFMMAKNKWYSTDRELTLAALKWCELFYVQKGKKD